MKVSICIQDRIKQMQLKRITGHPNDIAIPDVSLLHNI